MDPSGADKWHGEVLHIAGLWIETSDHIRPAGIGNPQVAVFVRGGAERHPARTGHVVFHVHDVHRIAAEGSQRFLVTGHVRGRFGEHGIRAEQLGEIGRKIVGILVRDIREGVVLGRAHIFDAVSPAFLIARHGRHAALKFMADRAISQQQVLPFGGRPELLFLVEMSFIPADGASLQREIKRGTLVRGETYARAGIGAIAGGHDLHAVIAGWQFLEMVAPLGVRKNDHRHPHLRVASFHEGALKRRAIRAFDGSGDCRSVASGSKQNAKAYEPKKRVFGTHPPLPVSLSYRSTPRWSRTNL